MSNGSEWGKKKLRELRNKYGNKCSVIGCDRNRRLEFAHLKETEISKIGRGRGMNSRARDILDNPDKYMLLCKSHHDEYDAGTLNKDRISVYVPLMQ